MSLHEFRRFLVSRKVAETVTAELRSAISVDTGLEAPLRTALVTGRDVVVAGSAGGGKTHLLQTLNSAEGLPRAISWPDEPEPARDRFVRVVSDATALAAGERNRIFAPRPSNCLAVAVGINEGPLLNLMRAMPSSPFAEAVQLLHRGQVGAVLPTDLKAPVVIDVGGYDPVQSGVVTRLMALPILKTLVQESPCSCEDPRVCPRRLAWQLLDSERLRRRLNDVLRVANMAGQAVLFRELWDFVSDLALGGTCANAPGQPPTSPWFYRVFYGTSRLSSRLQAVADPGLVVFPRLEAHIWHKDWHSARDDLLDQLAIIPLAAEGSFGPEEYRWIKSQLFFVVRAESVLELLREQVDLVLTGALEGGRASEIIGAINRYMSYGTRPPSQQVLELWTDLSVERRMDRAHGQVSIGEVPSSDFEIRRSAAVINHQSSEQAVSGPRYFLVHKPSQTSLGLTPEALSLLRGGRSYRSSDRPHTDMEWHVSRFFSKLGTEPLRVDRLDVMQLDFEAMRSHTRSYRLSATLGRIEPVVQT